MKISYAITYSRSAESLTRLVDSIRRFGGTRHEVLVASEKAPPAKLKVSWQRWDGLNLSAARNQLYRAAQGDHVHFLDDDTELPAAIRGQWPILAPQMERRQTVFGGPYLNPPALEVVGRSYNLTTNLWFFAHQHTQPVVLAGNFIIPKVDGGPEQFPFSHEVDFGGEEVPLLHAIRRRGWVVECKRELGVYHHASRPLHQFFGRARLHGAAPRWTTSVPRPALGNRLRCMYQMKPDLGSTVLAMTYLGVVAWQNRLR